MNDAIVKRYSDLFEKRYMALNSGDSADYVAYTHANRHWERALYLSGRLLDRREYERKHDLR